MTINEVLRLQSRRFAGNHCGPLLLITAGVHGDEYLPMLAVKELIQRFERDSELSNNLRGSLKLIPVVNRSAYRLGHRCGKMGRISREVAPVGRTEPSPNRLRTH